MIETIMESLFMPVAKEVGSDILLKATLVISLAGLLSFLCRRSSAALRYAIWSAALVALIVLPVMSIILPQWSLEQTSQFQVMSNSGSPAPVNSKTGPAPYTITGSATEKPATTTGAADEIPAAATAERSATSVSGVKTAVAILVTLWLCGAVILLLRLAFHVFRVNQITLRTGEGSGKEISKIAAPLVASLGIRRRVRIVTCVEASTPFSWGIWNPAVIFPAAAKEWPLERKRSVLLHELAHIARWDYVVHLLVEIVRALYWPNPLVRLAARRSAMERERACDDFALRHGTPSAEYADHLLHIARLQVEQCVPVGAVTMAGEPGLVERIKHVMNKTLNRSPLHPGIMMLAAVLAITVVLPLATLDVLGAKQGMSSTSDLVETQRSDDDPKDRQRWKIPSTSDLIETLRSDDDPKVRQRAAWWLGEHETDRGVRPLIEGLSDESAGVRLVSAWALGEIKDEDSIDPLIDTLEDDDDQLVREMAALALGEIEDPSAVEPLVDAFEKEEDLRAAVVWALGEIENRGSRKARRARSRAFNEMDEEPWDNEQVWTGTLPRRVKKVSEDVTGLIEELSSNNAQTRRKAALNLGVLGMRDDLETGRSVEKVVDALIVALSDPVPEVRAAAVWSLDEINPSRSDHFGKSKKKRRNH